MSEEVWAHTLEMYEKYCKMKSSYKFQYLPGPRKATITKKIHRLQEQLIEQGYYGEEAKYYAYL